MSDSSERVLTKHSPGWELEGTEVLGDLSRLESFSPMTQRRGA